MVDHSNLPSPRPHHQRWKIRSNSCTAVKIVLVQHREVASIPAPFANALRGALARRSGHHSRRRNARFGNDRARADRGRYRSPRFRHFAPSNASKAVDRIIDVFLPPSKTKSALPWPSRSRASLRRIFSNASTNLDASPPLRSWSSTPPSPISCAREKTHQIPGMIQVGKKKGNQPLDDAIMEHLRHARISPEEAFDKCIDKKKFRQFLAETANRRF